VSDRPGLPASYDDDLAREPGFDDDEDWVDDDFPDDKISDESLVSRGWETF
jgi:hypothetical protein